MGAAWSVVEWLVGYVLFMLAYFLSIFSLIFPRINIFFVFLSHKEHGSHLESGRMTCRVRFIHVRVFPEYFFPPDF